jgi:hypothetical protein
MRFPIRDSKSYLRLLSLSADEVIGCFLRGEFTIGEDVALIEAIQKGLSLKLNAEKITAILLECSEDGASIEACRQRLLVTDK